MALSNRIAEHRSGVILATIVSLCLVSLASGTSAMVIGNVVRTVFGLAWHPVSLAGTRAGNSIDYVAGLVIDYDGAVKESRQLREELANLQRRAARRAELSAENERLRRMLDFERTEPRLVLKPAEVIGRFEGTLIVDRGSMHGVKRYMCAITPEGIVGVVTRVEPFRSYVFTLYNAEYTMFAMTRRNRVRGRVRGSSAQRPVCKMEYIDLKDDVRPGDEVVTSPESVFPGGYPIGTVTDVDERGPYLKTAHIVPAVNPYQVDEVFLVYRADVPVANLTETNLAESLPEARILPDDRPLQERLAP